VPSDIDMPHEDDSGEARKGEARMCVSCDTNKTSRVSSRGLLPVTRVRMMTDNDR
jgi:hypothetical protein